MAAARTTIEALMAFILISQNVKLTDDEERAKGVCLGTCG